MQALFILDFLFFIKTTISQFFDNFFLLLTKIFLVFFCFFSELKYSIQLNYHLYPVFSMKSLTV